MELYPLAYKALNHPYCNNNMKSNITYHLLHFLVILKHNIIHQHSQPLQHNDHHNLHVIIILPYFYQNHQ